MDPLLGGIANGNGDFNINGDVGVPNIHQGMVDLLHEIETDIGLYNFNTSSSSATTTTSLAQSQSQSHSSTVNGARHPITQNQNQNRATAINLVTQQQSPSLNGPSGGPYFQTLPSQHSVSLQSFRSTSSHYNSAGVAPNNNNNGFFDPGSMASVTAQPGPRNIGDGTNTDGSTNSIHALQDQIRYLQQQVDQGRQTQHNTNFQFISSQSQLLVPPQQNNAEANFQRQFLQMQQLQSRQHQQRQQMTTPVHQEWPLGWNGHRQQNLGRVPPLPSPAAPNRNSRPGAIGMIQSVILEQQLHELLRQQQQSNDNDEYSAQPPEQQQQQQPQVLGNSAPAPIITFGGHVTNFSMDSILDQGPAPSTTTQPLPSASPQNPKKNKNVKASTAGRKPNPQQQARTFPEKLMQAIVDVERADDQTFAWLPDGKSFVVVDSYLFCRRVLRKYFKETKYSSFVRKLHRWGFVRLTSGTGTDCFFHPKFQKDEIDLVTRISPPGKKNVGTTPARDRAFSRGGNGNSRPPSLAGVEKFIRTKFVASASTGTTK